MKKNEAKKGQKNVAKAKAAKDAKAATTAAPAPEATTTTAAAPIVAPAATQRHPKAKKAAKTEKRPSGLDAAAQVLKDAGQPMNTKTMVETMLAKGLWATEGKTPAATIYAAILREIHVKGKDARFKKTDRGLFTLNA